MEKELINNSQSNIYPFHMPGHKRRGSDIGAGLDPYAIDITEIDNFDNLHHAEGIIKEAQAEAAALYGAKCAYFLINGSTCGILAAISAATKRGDKVLVARNCHKAVYHALYLRQLHPCVFGIGRFIVQVSVLRRGDIFFVLFLFINKIVAHIYLNSLMF